LDGVHPSSSHEVECVQTSVKPTFDPSWSPRILVVDSDEAVADLTRRVLRRFGFEVIAASDGVEAVDRWRSEAPDVVLLEVNLGKIGGFAVCDYIRRMSRTPIIMLTTSQDEEDVVRAFAAGADDYMTKPFSPFQLVARITVLLERRAS
jgi:DNA-binding response OmpR family regulator